MHGGLAVLPATGGGPTSGELRMDPIAVRDLIILVTVAALVAGTLLALRATQPEERRRRRE
jgi:hypothetical protein